MRKPYSLMRRLSNQLSKVNREKDLGGKIAMLPIVPKELAFDSKEIARHISKNPANAELFTEPLLGADGLLTPDAHNFFLDEIDNESEIIESYDCSGSEGEFEVSIMEWRGIFWVQAPEFDDVGYFLDIEHAQFYAKDIAESYPSVSSE